MLKNNYLRYASTLAIICLAASGFSGVVFNLTRPKIPDQYSTEEKRSLREVFPRAYSFEPVQEGDKILYFKALDRKKNVLGFVFETSRRGYSSDIVTMAGMDKNGMITRIKILSQNETPGVGSRITEGFQEQFSDKKADEVSGSVNAITGATISSRAVIDSIQAKAREILEKVRR